MEGKSPENSPMSSLSPSGVCAAGVNAATTDCSPCSLKDPSPAAPGTPRGGADKQGRRHRRRSCLKSPTRANPEHQSTAGQTPSAKGTILVARLTRTQDSGTVHKDEAAATPLATTGGAAEVREATQGKTEAQCAGNSLSEVALAADVDASGRPDRETNQAQGQAAMGRPRPCLEAESLAVHGKPRLRSDAPMDPRGIVGEAFTSQVANVLDNLLRDFRSVAHVFRRKERSLLATAEDTVPTSDEVDCNSFVKIPGRLSPLRAELLSSFASPPRARNSGSGSFEQRGGVHFACFAALTAAGSLLLLLLIYSLRALRRHALQGGNENRCRRSPGNCSSAAVD